MTYQRFGTKIETERSVCSARWQPWAFAAKEKRSDELICRPHSLTSRISYRARMRSAFGLILGTLAALAQTAPPASLPEIRGTVVEGGTNGPVADAKITVSVLEDYSLKEVTKITTDANGAFQVTTSKLGEFIIR